MKPKQAGADQVPEGDRDEEVDRPAVLAASSGVDRVCRQFSQASNPRNISGTTSSALNTEPNASAIVGVPLK